MIVSACVIFQTPEGQEIKIPCHRHEDAFAIMEQFNLPKMPFRIGFLDHIGIFMDARSAKAHAFSCGQINELYGELHTEELW